MLRYIHGNRSKPVGVEQELHGLLNSGCKQEGSRLSWRLRSWCSRSVAGTNRAPTVTPTLPDGDVMSLPVVVVLLLRPPVVAEHMGSIPSIPAIT